VWVLGLKWRLTTGQITFVIKYNSVIERLNLSFFKHWADKTKINLTILLCAYWCWK